MYSNSDENNITVVTVQGGCTGKVQPLDVSLNKPFKACVRGVWKDYMLCMGQASSCQTIPTASKDEIVQWIINANTCLSEQGNMIFKTFLVCGISNQIDGSENHIIRILKELPNFTIPYGASQD